MGMPHHVASQSISSLTEVDRCHNLTTRGRKMSSTGGNRSWSEEEENYLLQTRMQKMPYKHIAAHLKKTELACRLHYHQLSHGSHRRKRTGSVSSANSAGSASSYSTGSSPRAQYPVSYGHDDDQFQFGVNSTPSYNTHKVLLPKPAPLTPPEPDHSGLRINTQMQGALAQASSQPGVDTNRLRAIYDQHRSTFWNAIAADYGTDMSPTQLEAIWHHNPSGGLVMRPPTPGDSPDRMRQSLKPSAMPPFNPYGNAAYPGTDRTSMSMGQYPATVSAVNDPTRMGYFPPAPNNGYGLPRAPTLSRSATWSYQPQPPQGTAPTAISSLLTDNKCPRGAECSGINCKHGHY